MAASNSARGGAAGFKSGSSKDDFQIDKNKLELAVGVIKSLLHGVDVSPIVQITIEDIKEIDTYCTKISTYTEDFINSLKHPNDFFELVKEKYHLYHGCIVKFLAFDQILQFDLKSKFDMLQKTILKQLNSFQTYSYTKSICQLQDKHFLSVEDCCALVRPFMSRKLNEFSETLQRLVNMTERKALISDKIGLNYLDCILKIQTIFCSLEQTISLAFEDETFNGYILKMNEVIFWAENLTRGTLQCIHFHSYGIVTKDDYFVNLIDFYAIVSWIGSDLCHDRLEEKAKVYACQKYVSHAELVLKNNCLPKETVTKIKAILSNLQKGKTVNDVKRHAMELKELLPIRKSDDTPSFYEKLFQILENIKAFVINSNRYWSTGEPARYRINLSAEFSSALELEFRAAQLKHFQMKLDTVDPADQARPSQSNNHLAIFGSSQQCLHSLSFLKQLDMSYQSLDGYYDKMKEYEDVSITAINNVLDFLRCLDEFGSLYEELTRLKQTLVSYGTDHSNEHLQAMLSSVDVLVGLIQEAVSASSVYGKGEVCSAELDDLIKPQQDELLNSHVNLNFFVIVSKKDWNLERNAKFDIAMAFHVPKHGDKSLRLKFHSSRNEADYLIMTCGVAVKKNLAGTKLYYKYLLFPFLNTPVELIFIKNAQYEEASYCYRVIDIPQVDEKDIYDSCIYPQKPDKKQGRLNKFWYGESLKQPGNLHDMSFCADAHLKREYDEIERCEIGDINQVCEKILSVYQCSTSARKANIKDGKSDYFYKSTASEVFQNQLGCLLAEFETFDHPSKILSGLVICRCLSHISRSRLSKNVAKRILSTVAVSYYDAKSYCPEFDTVRNAVAQDTLKQFIEPLRECMIKAGSENFALILKALPLYHWFDEKSPKLPFFSLDKDVDSLSLMIEGQDRRVLPLSIENSDFIEAITQLEHVQIQGDPLLQVQLIRASSNIGHYSILVKFVTLPIILLDLGIKLKSHHYQSQEKIRNIISALPLLWQKKDTLNFHDALEYMQFFLNSLGAVTKTLHSLKNDGRSAVETSFKLLLHAMYALEVDEKRKQLQLTVPFIKDWARVNVGENFSCGSDKDIQREHQFFVAMYAIDDNSLEWKEILQAVIFDRFEKIKSFELMTKVFNKLILLSNDHDIIDVLRDCLVKHVSLATDKDLQLLAKGSVKSQSILINLIETKFPILPDNINTLLEWYMWPTILSALMNTPSNKSQKICRHVMNILKKTQCQLEAGEITVELLLHLESKWDTQLFHIMSALSMNHDKFLSDVLFANKRVHTFKILLMLLKRFVSSITVGLPSLLIKADELLSNHHKSLVNSLCTYDDDIWSFPSFPEAETVIPMLIQFAIMNSETLKNDIFYYKMQQLEKNITHDSSLEEIYLTFWLPLFDHCCNVADKLKNETITLNSLSKLFGDTESADSEKTIEKLISAVEKCHADCSEDIGMVADLFLQTNDMSEVVTLIDSKPLDIQWMKTLGRKIADWSNVHQFSNEADQLMDTLEAYGLKKSLVYNFSKQGIQDFQQQMLNAVTDDDYKILLFLKKSILVRAEVKESIKKFGECKDLRSFIKVKSKDVSEMERFIQIALDIVAGEGAEKQDRLIDLSELCGKFYPLLYQLDSTNANQSISTTLNLFEQTWDSLKTFHDPLTLTDSCISNVKWYLFIGQLQGAGEQGTVKQLHDINEHGEYTVSTTKDAQHYTVTLTIRYISNKSHISKKFWTLGDLHEIESKLVLITRKASKWAEAKNKFQEMLAKVCQICDAVQKLKEYGHMKYLTWRRTLACSNFVNDLKSLDKKIEELEQQLSTWISYVWRCRYHYSELNFYKSSQLIALREELTKVEKNEDHQISHHVFHLLNSAIGKPLESELIVRKALKGETLEDKDDQEQELATKKPSSEQTIKTIVMPEAVSKVSLALAKVRDDNAMSKVYDEAIKLGYEDYLILQALLHENITDIFVMMEWHDELLDDQNDKFQKEWMVNEAETKKKNESTSDLQMVSTNGSAESVNDIDVSHVASYFFKRVERGKLENITEETDFISLEMLGKCLQRIATKQVIQKERDFLKPFKLGEPNLVITPADNIFTCTLQIYSSGKNNFLPTFDEVFLCSESTTLEEITIFWMRVLGNHKNNQIYCLLHGEKLPYLIAEESMDLLKYLSQGNKGYKLVIICSNEEEGKSNVISRLYLYRREWNIPTNEDMECLRNFIWRNITEVKSSYIAHINASSDNSQVRVFYSEQAGVGKSLSVRKLKDNLVKVFKKYKLISEKQNKKAMITLPLHGPVVTADEVLAMLLKEESDLKSCIIHIDIPMRVLRSIDDIVFSLLILGGLTDSRGNVWRRHPSQLYAIELTLPSNKSYISEFAQTKRVINLLKLFPGTECLAPKQLCNIMTDDSKAIELRTPMYQRVYQYLKLLELKDYSQLEKFTFVGTLKGSDKECLETIIKHSNILTPTWKEVRHFVWFLNIQLSACEQSNIIKRVPGLRTFVVDFMRTMSCDFATSSMSSESTASILRQHVPTRRWDESMHPYLFFNKNRTSITHVGLQFERKGSHNVLLDTYTRTSIKDDVSPELYGFLTNSVKIPTHQASDCSENELIKTLLEFMDIKTDKIESPDETYVLTQDNLTKIMAIQTRFRCQIPVVLMGETGCGKTHLIRYMCNFATYKNPLKNMFILKVHGGTTEEDVIECVAEAEKAALENRKHKIDTVVFFDEANTSDVISLIKEIMCDGRCRGKLVPPFLKFVAACNPYRKHSAEMIKKLRGAGLGWRDEEASNNAEKLGGIPLRDLVYRVLELPDSMKALVYDFGQLKYQTERDYIVQMAHNKLHNKDDLSLEFVVAIADVLANCQDFSKQMKV